MDERRDTDCRAALQSRLSLFAILLLLISSGNLYGIGLALWYHNTDSLTSSRALPDKWGTIAIALLACSQILYLIFFFAWLFQWVRFYRLRLLAFGYCAFDGFLRTYYSETAEVGTSKNPSDFLTLQE